MLPRWFFWLFLVFLGYLIFMGTQPVSAPQTVAEVASPAITPKTYPTLSRFSSVDYWKRSLNPGYAAEVNCKPPTVSDGLAFSVIDEVLGQGAPAMCGEEINVDLTVWNAAGKSAYNAEKLNLTLGHGEIAAGLDAGLVGIRVGGTRTLILPPATLARDKKSAAPKALLNALPNNKTVIVTARRLQ